jgi:hypothetical protein
MMGMSSENADGPGREERKQDGCGVPLPSNAGSRHTRWMISFKLSKIREIDNMWRKYTRKYKKKIEK